MVNKKKIELGLSDEEEVDKTSSKNTLSINKNYADRYEKWRNKEEIQKRKYKLILIFYLKKRAKIDLNSQG